MESIVAEIIKIIKDAEDSVSREELVDHITVYSQGEMRFTLRDGTEIMI